MVIEAEDSQEHTVRFEEREMADILALDDGLEDEDSFVPMAAVSEFNDRLYRIFLSPWVRAAVTDDTARLIRRLHPLRVSRYAYGDANPWMMPFAYLAPEVKKNRRPVSADNPFVQLEKSWSRMISDSLNWYRGVRDQTQEFWFKTVFGNPLVQAFFPEQEDDIVEPDNTCKLDWLDAFDEGGFAEGVARIMVAMAHTDESLQRRVLKAYDLIAQSDHRLAALTSDDYQDLIRKQACILNSDENRAIAALATLIPEKQDRAAALAVAEKIALADQVINAEEEHLLERIRRSLEQ
jgi:tellurite resistance protein